MRIDKTINLVIPVTRSDGTQVFVHSTPISSDVFDTYFLIISKTFAAIYSEGLNYIAGPRIAAKMLRKIAMDAGVWEGKEGIKAGLMAEIHRLTLVMCIGKNGWEQIPLDQAVAADAIDAHDVSEIEGSIVFFTAESCMRRKSELKEYLDGAMKLWGARTESLNSTEFLNSLPTLTKVASTGEKAAE